MAAALIRRRTADDQGTLQTTNFARDLYQIAELIEVCFQASLDTNGRASIREMKTTGRLGPLLWIYELLELLGLGLGRGFVWRVGRRVVGNVSIYSGGSHPWWGRGHLIANVAVHPTYQRRGIARSLMQAALGLIERMHSRWAALEVEADNIPAVELYNSLGFETYETLNHWELNTSLRQLSPLPASIWKVRPRLLADTSTEIDLIFTRARVGGMAWTQSLTQHDVQGGLLSGMTAWVDGLQSRWVLPNPANPNELLGATWVELTGWRSTRVSIFLDPGLTDLAGRQALLRYALRTMEAEDRIIRVETVANDPAVEDLLREVGFRKVRSLTQMRYHFDRRG